MILQNILKYRNGSNFAHTLLSTIKSSGANPPEKNFFLIMLINVKQVLHTKSRNCKDYFILLNRNILDVYNVNNCCRHCRNPK